METTSNVKVMSFINTSKTPTIPDADREIWSRVKIIRFESNWVSQYPKS